MPWTVGLMLYPLLINLFRDMFKLLPEPEFTFTSYIHILKPSNSHCLQRKGFPTSLEVSSLAPRGRVLSHEAVDATLSPGGEWPWWVGTWPAEVGGRGGMQGHPTTQR